MVSYLNEEYKMTGLSGRRYTFSMYGFGTFDDLQEAFKEYPHAGLYVFTQRDYSQALGKYVHKPVYVGQTNSFQARDYANHHKRRKIESIGSHSFGICLADYVSDEHRMEMEGDILKAYELRCNDNDN